MLDYLKYFLFPWSIISELRRQREALLAANSALEDALMEERMNAGTTLAAMVLQQGGEFFVGEESIHFVSEQEVELHTEPTQGGVLMFLEFEDFEDECEDCDCDGECRP